VAETAAKSVKRVHLELGGKAPVVVFPDADLRAAAAGVRNAGFWNAGQDCGAACRVLVHESVAEEFTDHLVREVSTLVVGSPEAGDDVEIGPMISRPHFERVKESLAEAKAAGLNVAIGGSALEGPGYFIEPTVISNVPAGAHIATHEIFGPVVTVETFQLHRRGQSRGPTKAPTVCPPRCGPGIPASP
jgi:aminobutyraldehyde dehydrogenase